MTDTVIISIDWNDETNTGVLVVGRKRVNKSVDIINAFRDLLRRKMKA